MNIPLEKQYELEMEYSEQPIYCTECKERLFEEDEIENGHHEKCYEQLIEKLNFI